MTTGRHLVHEAIYDDYVAALAAKAAHLPVGDPATGQVALGPVIDERQRDKIHALVTASAGAGAKVAAGGSYEGLFYQPTVLSDVTPEMPAYADEVFGPVAPVLRFATADEAGALAARSGYGLSLGILTRDVMRGLDLARRIPTGIVHINEQTVDDEPNVPFGWRAGLGDRNPLRRHGEPRGLHRDTVGHHPPGHRPLSVLTCARTGYARCRGGAAVIVGA
jgi:benzaldehyde dehydrogenase (NAD)